MNGNIRRLGSQGARARPCTTLQRVEFRERPAQCSWRSGLSVRRFEGATTLLLFAYCCKFAVEGGDGTCSPRCRSVEWERARGRPGETVSTHQIQQRQVPTSSPPEANMRCVRTVSEGGLDWPSRDRWRAASCRAGASRCRVGQ